MSANEPTRKNEGTPPAPTTAYLRPLEELNRKRSVIPPKWEKHRKRLLALRSYLEVERRNHSEAAKEPMEPFSMNMADAATDEFDHDLALSLLSAEQAALYEIDEALARIENGTYGICETTGEPIPEARLNAVPWTRLRVDVERRLERQGETCRVQLGQLHSATGQIHRSRTEAVNGEEELPNDELLFLHKNFSRKLKNTKS
jgi:RNA polymerase-binding protein DksA